LWRERGELDRACAVATAGVALAAERSVAVDAAADGYLTLAHAALDRGGDAEGPLGELAALLARDPWLGWRLEARLELARARAALVAGDANEARRLAVAGRLRLDRAAALRERVAADAIEGEAMALLGEPEGLELVERARASAEQFGSPHLIDETDRIAARAKAALSGTVSGR
jgi:hypothetical protein